MCFIFLRVMFSDTFESRENHAFHICEIREKGVVVSRGEKKAWTGR